MQTCNDNILVNLHEALKQKRGELVQEIDYNCVAYSSVGVGYINGKKIKRTIFYLRSKGCEWSCTQSGGCFMCGHYFGTSKGQDLPERSFINQFKKEYAKHNFSDIPMICIYNAGSILNDNEISNDELLEILNIVNENKDIKRVVLESRPEFINYEILSKISEVCKDTIVEIGIGLETADDYIRTKCVNKGFSFNSYIQAVCKIKKFSNIKVLTYLTVKPIFLTIQEGIDDVVNSIKTISDFTDIISLEPVSIQKNTLIEYLYEQNMYQPPKGWMVRDIIMKLASQSLLSKFELRIGGFEFFPIPDLVISNCELCNEALYYAIDDFNSTENIAAIEALHCECEEVYQNEKLSESNELSLEERISNCMNQLLLCLID